CSCRSSATSRSGGSRGRLSSIPYGTACAASCSLSASGRCMRRSRPRPSRSSGRTRQRDSWPNSMRWRRKAALVKERATPLNGMKAVATVRRRPSPARTHAERRLVAESRIVQAAFDIVARRGVDQVTLAEVGEEAGYSRALAAHYFESKEALLAAVAEHALEQYRRKLDAAEPARSGREALLASIAFYFNETRKWPRRLRALFEVTNAGLRR